MRIRTNIFKCVSVCMAAVLALSIFPGKAHAAASKINNAGMNNSTSSLNMHKVAGFDAGETCADGGVMEIVAYNSKNGYAYAINGQSGVLSAISMKGLTADGNMQALVGSNILVRELVSADGFVYGDMTSVAVSPDGTMLAAAVQAEGYADCGVVAFFQCNSDGTLTFNTAVEVGVQPDMVTFTPDGTKVLTANEGEPRMGYGTKAVDPAGSVSIITTTDKQVTTVGFEAFDGAGRSALVEAGIVLKKDTEPSVDLEPEYIACTNTTAYISLQEANAIAVLSLETFRYTGIHSVGFEDYSKVAVDLDKGDEKYAPKTYSGVMGIRMPDGIYLYTIDGVDYLLTANEGDSRDWDGYCNEVEVKKSQDSPAKNIKAGTLKGKVVYFDVSDHDGLIAGKDYLFGGRSFTMFRITDSGLEEVFDSGNDFERLTYQYLPEYFNCSNDDLSIDDRSGKKGPEPETVVVGSIGSRIYAFITLERIGGVMAYEITDPENVRYVNYINSRDFGSDVGSDDSPEGLCFVPAENSPTHEALLLAACEVGGTVAVYQLTYPCDNHRLTEIEAVASTCVVHGSSACFRCLDCGKYFEDAAGKVETTVQDLQLPLAEHLWQWKIDKQETATEDGIKHEECPVCGEKRNENTAIPKADSAPPTGYFSDLPLLMALMVLSGTLFVTLAVKSGKNEF